MLEAQSYTDCKSNQISRNHDKGRESLLKVFPNIPFNDDVDFEIEEFLEEPKSLGFRYGKYHFIQTKMFKCVDFVKVKNILWNTKKRNSKNV